MQLTERDKQILLSVHTYGFLTSHQIEALIFHTGRNLRSLRSQCHRRLQLLYHHGYLTRIRVRVVLGEGRKPFVYALDTLGAIEVAKGLSTSRCELNWRSKQTEIRDWQRLEHDIRNNDTWVVIERLVQAEKLERPYWLTQRQLKAPTYKTKLPFIIRNNQRKYKAPDSYFALKFPGYHELAHCFYEEDRATESEKMWREKVDAYIQYRQQNHAATHFGSRNFRVLTKTVNEDRLAQLKVWTERSGGDAMFWFTTELKVDIWQPTTLLEPIWEVTTAQGVYPLTVKDAKELRLNDS